MPRKNFGENLARIKASPGSYPLSFDPHCPQNRASLGFELPHLGQTGFRVKPQLLQNLEPGGLATLLHF